MLQKLFASIIVLLFISITGFKNDVPPEPIAVIELFTSQGCSSCPPADRLLSRTIADARKNGKKIYALSFHVDYWNNLGWTDPFSDKKYSERQYQYVSKLRLESAYTPQAVINGTSEMVGSNENLLADALAGALRETPKAVFKSLTFTAENRKVPHIKYQLEGDFADSKINFALVSTNETTSVKRGENSGKVLTGENIVYQFISTTALPAGDLDLAPNPLPSKEKLVVIAYIQRNNDLKITGAAMAVINF